MKKVSNILKQGVAEFFISYYLYRLIFWCAPNLRELVLVDGYSFRAGMICAAKDSGVNVSELQHGVITKYHMGYSYPRSKPNQKYIPDRLYVWSDFWRESLVDIWPSVLAIYPNRYLESKKFDYLHMRRQENAVVVISQGAIARQLADIVLCNQDRFKRFEVYYKLHPSEYGNWHKNQSLVELSKKNNFHIVEDVDLYELFSICNYQIGVFSTALFEGLALGCKLVLVDLPGVEYMSIVKNAIYLDELN